MKAPLNWVKEYIQTRSAPEKIADELLLAGTKVENIKKVGKEPVFELEITPNRPDTLSMVGVAREIAAVEQKEINLPETELLLPQKNASGKVDFQVLNKKLCPHYSIVRFKNVSVGKSPEWMADFLNLASVRSVNNVVDITNFVMLELGQPMHAFDYSKIEGRLLLRGAKENEVVKTLDGVERKLPEGAIIIEDQKKIVDLAGLMGGENSEIEEGTTDVVLLVPVYDPVTIRKTSLLVNLRTEASNRFEKKLDPNLHSFAINRAVKLFTELASANLATQIYSTTKVPNKKIVFDKKLVKEVIGVDLSDAEIIDLLSSANFILQTSKLTDDSFEIEIPTFRTDIEIPEDILEEISRLYGYNNLPKSLPTGQVPQKKEVFEKDLESKLREYFLRNGFSELTGYTLISKEDCSTFGFNPLECLKVKNPASSDFEYLRPTLLINAVKAVETNQGRGELSFFEIGKTFSKTLDKSTKLPSQPLKVAAISTKSLENFKGIVNELWGLFGLNISSKKGEETKLFSESLELHFEKDLIGFLGQVNLELLKKLEINDPTIYAMEIDFSVLESGKGSVYKPIPKFPSVKEDVSFYLPETQQIGTLIEKIYSLDPLIFKIDLKDVYSKGKERSVTLGFEFLDREKTLENKDIEKVRNKVINFLEKHFDAEVRKE